MYKKMFHFLLLLGYCLLLSSCSSVMEPPNILVIFTDDMGYADMGVQNVVDDIKTPNLDQLAAAGVRATSGYVTAPQCIPSRAGILTGQYQEKFGMDHNGVTPLPHEVKTIAERMKEAGYITGMTGKWHLDPNHTQHEWIHKNLPDLGVKDKYLPSDIPQESKIPYYPSERGFDETYWGAMNRYYANFDLEGNSMEYQWVENKDFRLDVQTDAALAFLKRNHQKPFFFYLGYFAPHVPLEAPEKYLSRFSEDMPVRRRYCLAMISAIDDGVGKIRAALKEYGIEENTLIFFISDNGAPLKRFKEDIPVSFKGGAWDGSLNDPLNGEKGMLSEGGIRVPFLVSWPSVLPEGRVYDKPVISLDVAATAVALAGLGEVPELDGVNLIPYLTGENGDPPHENLYWRFWNQTAVRENEWKFLKAGPREYLINLDEDKEEQHNLIEKHPEIAKDLKEKLEIWASELKTPGVPDSEMNPGEEKWYDFYFEEK